MAKRAIEQDSSSDKGGMRILYVELNGSNSSLQEGLRTLVAAMNKPAQAPPQTPRRLVVSHGGAPSFAEAEQSVVNQDTDEVQGVDNEATGQTEVSQNGADAQRKKRGEGVNRDRNAGLTIVKSLNLHPEGKESLKDFVAKKKPKTQEEHIAVYLFYLTRVLEEVKVGFSHIYTCFKETGERMPIDLPQTCRNAASKKGWVDTSDADDLKDTTRGGNFVEKDLPRAPDSAGEGTK